MIFISVRRQLSRDSADALLVGEISVVFDVTLGLLSVFRQPGYRLF